VERERELAALEELLAKARAGCGGIVVIEAAPGKGKSRLLTAAGDMARESGMLVLGAKASALERDFPFGIAIQLFEPRWVATGADERGALLGGSARPAEALLEGRLADPLSSPVDQAYPLIHALFWLACNLASPPADKLEGGPLVMLVDDAQWADRQSLRFLAYVAERITDLPIVLVLTVRTGDAPADLQALTAVRAAAGDVLRPASLSDTAVEAVVRTEFPDADPEFCRACTNATRGDPFLLVELLAQVSADGWPPDAATAGRLANLAPESVLDAVVARLGAMPAAAGALACAVAVLGDGEAAARAAQALADAHMFHDGPPLSFVHALIASAVEASMSQFARDQAHRRAASILMESAAPVEAVAAHLLGSSPEADPAAVDVLRLAAQNALATGADATAARLLARALAEGPDPTMRPEVLAELGEAEVRAGLPEATARLQEAIAAAADPERRATLALSLGRALYTQARYADAAAVTGRALKEVSRDDGEMAAELDAVHISAASLAPELAGDAPIRRQRLLERLADPPARAQLVALAHMAAQGSLQGEPRPATRELADRAWADGSLLAADPAFRSSWTLVADALLFADELEREIEICDAVLADAQGRRSSLAYTAVSYCRAWPLYEQGSILRAAAEAQSALDARPDDRQTHVRPAYGALALCHLQRGQLHDAEVSLAGLEDPRLRKTIHHPFLLDVRAQLRLVQQRPQEALDDAHRAGELLQAVFGVGNPGVVAWRSTAALAHLALGTHDRAAELAADELEDAQRIGVTRVVIRDLRVLGLATGGETGLELLREAVQVGDRYPARLEHIHALVDLGAALRRANQRTAAREPFRKALDLSYRGGARALAYRTRTELAATGARPRRQMLSGVESLTPSERRVAELAAQGLTTRRIAEALFVTPKTVEFHLRHTYRKLGVSSRTELTGALALY
jgi:DNA-binding CsgD family transcriptional regulator/tetratricopeptide (TPR) repeat protein